MLSKKVLRPLLFALVIASLVLAACAQPPAEEPAPVEEAQPAAAETAAPEPVEPTAPPAEPTEAPAAPSKIATFIFTQEFDTLNPYYTNMWFSGITQQFWNCHAWDYDELNAPHLVMVDELPGAENGGVSEDGKIITIKLRDDLKWSDGTPITSKDFVFTYEMVVSAQNAVVSQDPYDKLASVAAPDDLTVVATFNEPYAPWLAKLWKGLLPEHVLRPVFESDGTIDTADWNKAPTVGCGPFVFSEWESGSYARFVANENYWLGRPKLDEVFVQFVPDDASQIAALKKGEADLGTFISPSDVPDLEAAGTAIFKVASGYNEGIYFDMRETGHPAVKDVLVRQAIAYATDRDSINKDLLLGLTVPAATYWDNTPYNEPSLKPYPFDPEMAKQLLDQAGWVDSNADGTRDKDGVELMLTYGTTTREIRKDTQAVLQQQLAEVGIGTELLNYESDIFFGGFADGGPQAVGDLDMFEYSTVTSFPDPDTAEWLCSEIPSPDYPSGINYMGCIEELDAMFTQQAAQVDTQARIETFYQITKMIFDQALWIGLWQDPDIWAVSERLTNVKLSGANPFFNIMEWDLAE